ncbi:MAG TPA: hypothetical protein VEA19_02565 [Actinomycetota bacterium]|nr:hypothetical protein [Actinomycetota bacterium]
MEPSYRVDVDGRNGGWTVVIRTPGGEPAFTRACASEVEARTFASTVRQHLEWLSPERFREYYRLEAP